MDRAMASVNIVRQGLIYIDTQTGLPVDRRAARKAMQQNQWFRQP